ncbi:sporulation protein YlmC with PRC-barrel domain [Rhizobium sp. PP-F2F-G48]|uniref:PRC-barrel domain-containing protein n=1 Tax=Rhizobium sp. PP-F2F-G48 TaxID=2135651 RepID=UPI0010456B70|nr:PRC-barrel domain-containing protein [Rhizobium sp. PP-F2F-G48]TCM55937.1 sporulation protein YlmC with PRC-barrel domain [Rhizobium sp. PP-F2F-G48]
MLKTLLASTVLAATLAGTALAQQTPAAPEAPAASGATAPAGAAATSPGDDMLASNVIGKTVYTGVDEEGEAIGEVKDVVINAAGATEALVIGVGGFLGIGEKDVAVNFDRASWSDRDGTKILVVSMTKQDLEKAPAFQRKAVMDGAVTKDTAAAAPAAPSTSTAATPATPADGTATPLATPENTEVPLDAAGADPALPQTGTTPQMTDPDLAPDAATTAEPTEELKPVDAAMLSADKLIGTPVKVADDTKIGEVGDVILGKEGKLEAYIIDVGGFLGIAQKPVAMSAANIQVMADAKGAMTIYSPYTKEQLEAQPAYDAAAYKANPGSIVLSNPKP